MKQFTAQQKEIVARKLGYDGPMQGFDDYLASDPALAMRYNSLSGKMAQRMAKGGAVLKMSNGGFTDAQVAAYIRDNNLSPAQAAQAAAAFGVSSSQLASAQQMVATNAPAVQQASAAYSAAVQDRPDLVAQNLATYNPATGTGSIVSAPAPAPAAKAPIPAPAPATPAPAPKPAAPATPSFTDAQVAAYIYDNNLNAYQAQQAAAAFGVTPDQVSRANALIQNRDPAVQQASQAYNAAVAGRPDLQAQNLAFYNPANIPAKPPTTTTPNFANTPGAQAGPAATNVDTQGQMSAAPRIGAAPTVTATETELTPRMTPMAVQAGETTAAGVTDAQAAPGVTTGAVAAPTAQAAQAAQGVKEAVAQLQPAQGAVSQQAQITAAQQAPTTTAVGGLEAAQAQAAQVTGAPTRVAEAGEMISGPAVDQARVEQTLAQQQAAQGVVTEEMTVQGQLNKLLQNFDAGNPPPWAAASMRAATAQMAARGLSASSMAGQAIIQATLEAATPIAAADAKVFETMGLQNLSNRQQTAMLVGQQRAQFLGQEFDQAFQTRVLNAAKISDIANKNFDAQTQIAIENSRLANSIDIANLSARNAVVLGKMAQMSQLELTNLNNRQQVAVENARAFLQMDLKNLDNRQQTAIFKAQEINDALISDAGFANAVNITNAQNKLEADKVAAQLAAAAEQFNAEMKAKVEMANAQAANELAKFNAQQANERERFNAEMKAQVDIANAKILAEISTANTAAVNAANAVNAKNAVDLTSAQYAQQSQTYRDLLEMSWKTGESEKDRATELAKANISANASAKIAAAQASAAAAAKIGGSAVDVLKNWNSVKDAFSDIANLFSSNVADVEALEDLTTSGYGTAEDYT